LNYWYPKDGLFNDNRDADNPATVKSWRSNWVSVNPLFAYPSKTRHITDTTYTPESVNMG